MALEREESLHDKADRALRKSLEHAENLRAFLEQVVPTLADHFVYENMELLPRDFLMDNWRGREADLLYEIPYRLQDGSTTTAMVCVLIEHRSDLDPRLPLRTLIYTVLYWDRQWRQWESLNPPRPSFRLHPILPIVLYTGPRAWGSNHTLAELLGAPEELHRYAPRWEPLFWNLAEQPAETLLQSTRAWLNMMAVLRVQDEEAQQFADVYTAALRQLQGLADVDKVRWTELMQIVLTWANWHRPPEEGQSLDALVQQIIQDAQRIQELRTMKQTIAGSYVEQGEVKAMRRAVLQVGINLCGEPSNEERERLNNTVDLARLERWLQSAFEVESWGELLAIE